jgi:tetratricopeptide (TPR) repeat protein
LDVIKGHPLSARLVTDVLHEMPLDRLGDELTVIKVTGYLAQEILRRVELSSDEQLIMKMLSVFRMPVNMSMLTKTKEMQIGEKTLLSLADRCVLSFDGQTIEMHEAVRRFFYAKIIEHEFKKLHSSAASYYNKLFEGQVYSGKKDPCVMAEMVHHLSLAGEISELKQLRLLVAGEIKPAARKLYREQKNWHGALALYRLLREVVPDDVQVIAYIGRCYARLGQWNECDQGFREAINIAGLTGKTIWWIYRDWGHIKARYSYYLEAEEYFQRASEINPNDVSIKASRAYMSWKQGNYSIAYELFEEALVLEPYDEYTLTFFSKFLDRNGEPEYARILRDRLNEIQSGTKYIEPNIYEMELEYDDVEDI